MKLIFLGPPGAGKGTLAVEAAKALSVPHVSTGDIFRQAIKDGTPLGKQVKGILDSGGLVPDELTIGLVRERLARSDAAKGFILDGFPRTIPQAEALDGFAAPEKVVNFEIADAAVVERLSGRRVCKGCGKNYHVKFMPSAKGDKCEACGGELFTREDDKIDAIKNRLVVYRKQTEPLIGYYRGKGKILDIDAAGEAKSVFAAFMKQVGK